MEFRVVGVVTSPEFQKCRAYVTRLRRSYPKKYEHPDIRPMLNVEWEEYLAKIRRQNGKGPWTLTKPVAVFINGEFFGDDDDLIKYIRNIYNMNIYKNFQKEGRARLLDYLMEISDKGRSFVYLTIAVDEHEIGSMLFQLYTDLVPVTCTHFLKRCKKNHGGFTGTPIHRIVKPSWIQCGGWNNYIHHRQPCENYIVPHDRRGVLSMCHGGKHKDNSVQFHVSLQPTPWMDHYYVAFGQLVQGADILAYIENIPTYYETPLKKVEIIKSDEVTLCPQPTAKEIEMLRSFLDTVDLTTRLHEDVRDPYDTASVMKCKKYRQGLYCHQMDLQSHLPFLHLPSYLLDHCLAKADDDQQEEEAADADVRGYESPFKQDDPIPFLNGDRGLVIGLLEEILDRAYENA